MKTIFKGILQLLGELMVIILLLPIAAPVAAWFVSFDKVQGIYNSVLTVIDKLISIVLG